MMLSSGVRAAIEQELHRLGHAEPLSSIEPVSGGCISHAARLELADGARFFLKWRNAGEPGAGMFAAEAAGLQLVRETNSVRVPEVLALQDANTSDDVDAWILLEWLQPSEDKHAWHAQLGEQVAEMHRHVSEQFGGGADNFIGSLPQSNPATTDWPAFWRDQRIEPQLSRALESGELDAADARRFRALNRSLDSILAAGNADGASIVHGDLWGGNVHPLEQGGAAVIDPSAYRGHREVDLAMARLFGGFGPRFFEAYEGVWPLRPGHEMRRRVYQLYFLLVHVNCFGGAYAAQTRSTLAAIGF